MEDFSDPQEICDLLGIESIDVERLKIYSGTKENLIKRGIWRWRRQFRQHYL